MIEGVVIEKVEAKADERGRLVELFRSDSPHAPGFGQVHLTTVYPGVVKAWHRHRDRTDVLYCVAGTIRLGLYDDRPGTSTPGELREFFLGDHGPLRVTIPPGVWFGFKGVGTREALVVVLTDRLNNPRDPDEERLDPQINDIPFDWERRDR